MLKDHRSPALPNNELKFKFVAIKKNLGEIQFARLLHLACELYYYWIIATRDYLIVIKIYT